MNNHYRIIFLSTIFSTFLSTILSIICVVPAAGAPAGIGGPYGEFSMAYQGPETLTLFVVPDGSGDTFDQASLPAGGNEDATLTLLLQDAIGYPVPNYPREDIWLESWDGGLVACPSGTIADANTDANGSTHWLNPVHAGGHSEALTVVMVNGSMLDMTVGVKLSFNSPDINGDLVVNLSDVQLFAYDFFTAYDFRSDFQRDGVVNLSDLAPLVYAIDARCP